jgi:hypothetical protein
MPLAMQLDAFERDAELVHTLCSCQRTHAQAKARMQAGCLFEAEVSINTFVFKVNKSHL